MTYICARRRQDLKNNFILQKLENYKYFNLEYKQINNGSNFDFVAHKLPTVEIGGDGQCHYTRHG